MPVYARILGGTLEMTVVEKSPMAAHMAPGKQKKILHARLLLDARVLLASDWMLDSPHPGMRGFRLSVSYPTMAEAQRVFDALLEGGQVFTPFQESFFAQGFGMLGDRFGVPWMISGPTKGA
jgi:PhnB protein